MSRERMLVNLKARTVAHVPVTPEEEVKLEAEAARDAPLRAAQEAEAAARQPVTRTELDEALTAVLSGDPKAIEAVRDKIRGQGR